LKATIQDSKVTETASCFEGQGISSALPPILGRISTFLEDDLSPSKLIPIQLIHRLVKLLLCPEVDKCETLGSPILFYYVASHNISVFDEIIQLKPTKTKRIC